MAEPSLWLSYPDRAFYAMLERSVLCHISIRDPGRALSGASLRGLNETGCPSYGSDSGWESPFYATYPDRAFYAMLERSVLCHISGSGVLCYRVTAWQSVLIDKGCKR